MNFAITKKIGMTRIFNEDGKNIAITLLECCKGVISRIKTKDSKDGYSAVVVKIESTKKNKPAQIFEFRVSDTSKYKVGQEIDLSSFTENSVVSVSAKTKGKGFAGTIKRHGFHRGPVTHGSHNIRKPGSIGGGYPQRVVLGRKMPGRMGNRNTTSKNLKIVNVDTKNNIISIAGSIPGPKKGIVKICTEK